MLALVQSLTLGSGAACVAVISAFVGLAFATVRSNGIAYTAAVASGFLIASVVYWLPVLLGAQSAEFRSWYPIFLAYWFPAGASAAAAAVFLRRKFFKNAANPHA